MKWIRYLAVVSVFVASAASGQTATPTNTATNTPTFTNTTTPTPTLAQPATPGSSDWSAYKYSAFAFDYDGTGFDVALITVPGLKMGDSVIVYPPATFTDQICGCAILTNNTLRVVCTGGSDTAASKSYELLWFSRSQENCGYAPNCQRAPTPTNTPTP